MEKVSEDWRYDNKLSSFAGSGESLAKKVMHSLLPLYPCVWRQDHSDRTVSSILLGVNSVSLHCTWNTLSRHPNMELWGIPKNLSNGTACVVTHHAGQLRDKPLRVGEMVPHSAGVAALVLPPLNPQLTRKQSAKIKASSMKDNNCNLQLKSEVYIHLGWSH